MLEHLDLESPHEAQYSALPGTEISALHVSVILGAFVTVYVECISQRPCWNFELGRSSC